MDINLGRIDFVVYKTREILNFQKRLEMPSRVGKLSHQTKEMKQRRMPKLQAAVAYYKLRVIHERCIV